ncbi:hypothetical protein AEA09_18855 [Lysinibacillus contaminans]|uniref:DUF4097 domain-containing protein n=2 Tax=Lysinibacillus contaminans TaxID=1293441 RepID=A0ABR5JWB2_9BACI|nr:hypothetical protein AEA09_18855 [Lysinibacillus contaminans]
MGRKKLILGIVGGIIMSLFVIGSLNSVKSKFEYHSNIKHVTSITVNADLANIELISNHSELFVDFQGQKNKFGSPKIDITYDNDKALINVLTYNKNWKKLLPGKRTKGNIILNIPPQFLEEIHLETKNGNINIGHIAEINRLSLISDIGTIKVNRFQGGFLNVEAKSGSINLGEVDGQININNQVGGLNNVVLKRIQGENTIKVSNGNVKVKIPNGTDGIGLNVTTKNGKITSKAHKINIKNKGPGKELLHNANKNEARLNISVSVGNIELE